MGIYAALGEKMDSYAALGRDLLRALEGKMVFNPFSGRYSKQPDGQTVTWLLSERVVLATLRVRLEEYGFAPHQTATWIRARVADMSKPLKDSRGRDITEDEILEHIRICAHRIIITSDGKFDKFI